jgi:hypothetical protein
MQRLTCGASRLALHFDVLILLRCAERSSHRYRPRAATRVFELEPARHSDGKRLETSSGSTRGLVARCDAFTPAEGPSTRVKGTSPSGSLYYTEVQSSTLTPGSGNAVTQSGMMRASSNGGSGPSTRAKVVQRGPVTLPAGAQTRLRNLAFFLRNEKSGVRGRTRARLSQ